MSIKTEQVLDNYVNKIHFILSYVLFYIVLKLKLQFDSHSFFIGRSFLWKGSFLMLICGPIS